jgi:NOL1/NOP2/fmu family ribosome biogenesis protein
MGYAHHTPYKLAQGDVDLFEHFRAESLPGLELDPDHLAAVGSYLYLLPEQAPDLGSLRVIHPGWWLGTFRKGRFEPVHALALGLRSDQARQVIEYRAQSAEIAAYLRGETLPSPGGNGWVLVCVDGYPLGWGKRAQAVLKNHYPRGLRHA